MPVLQYCPPDQLQIDSAYQRSLEAAASQTLIRRIAVHWDWGLCQPLFVARRADGGLYVVDGQHRLAAAKLRSDIFQLPCVVTSFPTAEDEAASFVALNQQRRPLTKLDLFKAALAAGDMEASQISIALKDAGLRIANGSNNQSMARSSIANVGGLQSCYRVHGLQILTAALQVLAEAWPNQVLRFAGSVFPGIVAIVVDQQPLAEPGSDSVKNIAAFVGRTSQEDWFNVLAKASLDSGSNRRVSAERTFLRAWVEHIASPKPAVGSIAMARAPMPNPTYLLPAEIAFCDQCDQRVSGAKAAACASPFCSLKRKAA